MNQLLVEVIEALETLELKTHFKEIDECDAETGSIFLDSFEITPTKIQIKALDQKTEYHAFKVEYWEDTNKNFTSKVLGTTATLEEALSLVLSHHFAQKLEAWGKHKHWYNYLAWLNCRAFY